MTKHTASAIAAAVREGARLVESGNWKACDDSGRLFSGWLVGCIFTGDCGLDYAARTAFADWWQPGEYRNDGLRTNETAGERGIRIGRDATAAAMREFADQLIESVWERFRTEEATRADILAIVAENEREIRANPAIRPCPDFEAHIARLLATLPH